MIDRGSELFDINFQFHECVILLMDLGTTGYEK